MNTPKITATLNGEFGNAHSVKATVESALMTLYKGVCAEYNISEFRNDIIVSFDMKPQTNTQVLPTAVKTTPLFSEKTAIVHVDYSNEIFTGADGQPYEKPKLKNVYGAVLTGLIGADMIAKDRFNANKQPSATYKTKLKEFGISLKTKPTTTVTVKGVDAIVEKFKKELETIASIPVASTYTRPTTNTNDDPMVKIVCSVDCVASDIRITVKQSQLSIVGATLGKCDGDKGCGQPFVSEETLQATNQQSAKQTAEELINSLDN